MTQAIVTGYGAGRVHRLALAPGEPLRTLCGRDLRDGVTGDLADLQRRFPRTFACARCEAKACAR